MKLNWHKFISDNPNPTEAFETLAKRLFAEHYDLSSEHIEDPNCYPGVEGRPIDVKGKFVSYQAKLSEDESAKWTKLEESLDKAVDEIKGGEYLLDEIQIYLNWKMPKKPTKKDEFTSKYKKHNITLVWHFGKQILEKLETSDSPKIIQAKRNFFTHPEQPGLCIRTSNSKTGINKYHYTSQGGIEYIARQGFKNEMDEFLKREENFLWHIITADAGMGKSRAIKNYCSHLEDDWTSGWLEGSNEFSFQEWKPDSNTIIVIDYAMGRQGQLQKLLSQLITIESSLKAKVRVLIAERMTDPWLDKLTRLQTIGPQISEHAFKHEPSGRIKEYKIPPFNKGDKLLLANAILKKTTTLKISPEQLVSNTEKIDKNCRPLMMWLVADSITKRQNPEDSEDLLRDYIKGQRDNNWSLAGVSIKDEENAACITMCGGIPINPSQVASDEGRSFCGDIKTQKHNIILGITSSNNELRPIEPDMIGELHALDIIDGNNPHDLKVISRCFTIAHSINPEGLLGFIFRAANDFPDHPAFLKFKSMSLMPVWYSKIIQLLVLGLNKSRPKRSHEKLWEHLDSLVELMDRSTDSLRHQLANDVAVCAVNSSHGFPNNGFFKRSDALVKRVRDLAWEYNKAPLADPLLFELHSQALGNLINHSPNSNYSEQSKIKEMEELLKLFTHPNYPVEAKRQFVSIISTKFQNSVNDDSFENGGLSQVWFHLFKRGVVAADDSYQCYPTYMHTLTATFQKLEQKKLHCESSFFFDLVVDYLNDQSDTDVSKFLMEIFASNQRLRHTGDGNPKSYEYLKALAEKHNSAKLLLDNAYDPNETESDDLQ